jgi:RimJ/RimL family protein N-acetyltransferase
VVRAAPKNVKPDLAYTDGVITIRRADPDLDLDGFVSGTDDEQIDWLWDDGDREQWEALSPQQRRDHQYEYLVQIRDAFGPGPKWCFIGVTAAGYALYVDCALNSPDLPIGDANISYTCHPDYRGRGFTSRAVRLTLQFLADHRITSRAHILVHPSNERSLRVARAVGGREVERFMDSHGRQMIRHIVDLPTQSR